MAACIVTIIYGSAMAFMSLPSTLEIFIGKPESNTGFYAALMRWFSYTHPFYATLYFFLIIGFNYFYVSMQYNPVEIANNLRQSNGGVPGIRPGKPTSDYFSRILGKITLVGAIFLGIIAIFPIIFGAISGLQIRRLFRLFVGKAGENPAKRCPARSTSRLYSCS